MMAMIDFFLSLRKDLGLSNKGIRREHMIHFMVRESDLFLRMYEANKEVRFSQIIEAEKKLSGETDS